MIGLAKLTDGPGGVELAERAEAPLPPGQVRLEVIGCGVCGTDLHIEAGEYAAEPPVTLGHEVVGTVAELGEGVGEKWLGARVVCEPAFSTCGECRWCLGEQPNLCPLRRSIGAREDGGFAPRMAIPERNLYRVPEWLEPAAAALIEPLACVCQCMFDPEAVAGGDRVLVVGPGPMGLLAAQVAASAGAEVTVAGLPSDAERLRVAAELGLATTDATVEPDSVDVAIDVSGSAGGIAACLTAARRGGRFVLIGIAGGPVSVPLDLVLLKELRVGTGFGSTPPAWRRALALVAGRRVELAPLLSEVAPLPEWERVFADLRAGRKMKVVLDPSIGSR